MIVNAAIAVQVKPVVSRRGEVVRGIAKAFWCSLVACVLLSAGSAAPEHGAGVRGMDTAVRNAVAC